MKNRILYVITILSLCLSSCNSWLDVSPKSQIKNDEMFEKYSGFKDALTACYIKMNNRALYGQNMTMTSVEFLAQLWDTDRSETSLEAALKQYDYKNSSVENNIKNIYSGLYNVIIQANTIIKNMPSKGHVIESSQARGMIEGEAYAIRAFCHLDLLRLFGQMPSNATRQVSLPYSEEVSKEAVNYYTFDQFVKKIEVDLDKAELLLKESDIVFQHTFNYLDEKANELDDEFFGYRRFRFNYYAVRAIKARLYRYIGNDSKAYEIAQSIITAKNNNGTNLLELADNISYNNGYFSLPTECIVALSNNKLSDYIDDVFVRYDFSHPVYLEYKKLTNDLFSGMTSYNNRFIYAWSANNTNTSAEQRPILNKYYQNDGKKYGVIALTTRKQVIPLIRLSEMYLIAMESTTSLAEANQLYRTYMQSHGVLIQSDFSKPEELHAEIVNEYRREFYGEGQMFYTYKRLGEKTMLWNSEKEVGEAEYILPLPISEYNPNK